MLIGRAKAEVEKRAKQIRTAFHADREMRERLWNRQSGICVVCLKSMPLSNDSFLVVDHTTPIVHYATSRLPIKDAIRIANDEGNLAIVHSEPCNVRKGSWDLEDFHQAIARGELPPMDESESSRTAWEIENRTRFLFERAQKGGRKAARLNSKKLKRHHKIRERIRTILIAFGLKRLPRPYSHHIRFHVKPGILKPDCYFCRAEKPIPPMLRQTAP